MTDQHPTPPPELVQMADPTRFISIDSEQGRIGEIWWINSDQKPVKRLIPAVVGFIDLGMMISAQLIRWGSFGFGRHIRITMEPIDD